jgi:ATP-dependent DNA helicase RecQ
VVAVRDLIAESEQGISRSALFARARERINPDMTAGQLEAELERIEDEITVSGDLLAIRSPGAPTGDPEPVAREDDAIYRLVAVDLETVLRYTEQQPSGERTIFQVGAVRFGPDEAWAASAPPFDRFIRLPDELNRRIARADMRERVEAEGEAPEAVLAALLEYLDGADAVVAYNGRSFDFRLLDEALERYVGTPIPERIRRIDGLYIALAVWPVPPRRHALSRLINDERFDEIKDRLAIDLTGLVAHDAADDARMLADLMRFAVAEIGDWPAAKQRLARSVGTKSDAWRMLFGYLPGAPAPDRLDTAAVRGTIAESLAVLDKAPLRNFVTTPVGSPELSAITGPDGTVDVDQLVGAIMAHKGRIPSIRQSQRDMVAAMRGWVRDGVDALVEAPTGTGKSYAILAVALDWLAADRRNRVVISTFTRQLQRQLANDIYDLHEAGAAPGLIGITSLVKGAANRLSLAGLVRALADCTDPPRARRRGDFLGHPLFAELVLYLALRLMAKGTPVEEWEAHSVDPVDIEPFFEDYLADRPGGWSRRGAFLRYLSQAEARDYAAGEETPAEHTSLVKEVLAGHRLLITNHALLLRHLDDFSEPKHTLVVIDEAHSLESAATDALEAHFDYALVEEGLAEAREWVRPPASGATSDDIDRYARLDEALHRLTDFLEGENVPRFAQRALDAAGRDPLHRNALRVVTLASSMTRPVPPRDGFIRALEELCRRLGAIADALHVQPHRDDRLEDERRRALVDRFDDLSGNAARIGGDLLAIVAPDDPTAPLSNRVVWLDEQPRRGARPRDFRFGVTSSPIELAREPDYARLVGSFERTYYISATLQVDGSFGFIRDRLALPAESVAEIELPSPFEIERQAKLVCFTDFPSWTEQEQAAIRSVAQQVGRFLGEVAEGDRNGAMVLTTSRNAANEIYERLIEQRGSLGAEFAISSAGYLGTATAVEEFKRRGGGLVGTKGLWQGVDIDVPERLRLVWINKLPFASFADPVIVSRRELIRARAEAAGETDPDGYAVEHYYLPLAAMELRQAVGRLIRTDRHRGVIVISDRKLAGPTRLHRRYRQVFLGSLAGLVRDDETWGTGGGNLRMMTEGWREIWSFLAEDKTVLLPARAAELSTSAALEEHALLPSVRAIRSAAITAEELVELRAAGPEAVYETLIERATTIGRLLDDRVRDLRDYQEEALAALAEDRDVFAILPTSAGKSFIYQLPALALPGVTIVVSPLVALMTDQALGLNRSIGGAVRALVAPMRESNSRTGKAEVQQQLTGVRDHGIRLVYVSPERLSARQFQDWIAAGVEKGIVRRIAIDEAHTFATWGEDFRPSFKRAERFLARLREMPNRPCLLALTATATPSVRTRLRKAIFGLDAPDPAVLTEITRNPIRPELALYRRMLAQSEGGAVGKQALLEALVDTVEGHTIIYTLTIKEARTIHAALLEHLGESERDRIRLFHGRLTSSEKEAVAHDFVSAPRAGEEGFRPLIVVATAAFGLGVDRRDIRTVIVASPPADLAALYQELGRAGRDGAPATGLMIGSRRAFGTLAFMEHLRTKLDPATYVTLIADRILGGSGALDMTELAEGLIDEAVALGRITPGDADKPETLEGFRSLLVRVFAALAEIGRVEDRGDFPDVVKVLRRDDAPAPEAELGALLDAIEAAQAGARDVGLLELARALAPAFPGEADDPGELWVRLLELHSLGYLDVSQQSTKRQLTSLARLGTTLPADFVSRFVSDLARDERERIISFFTRRERPGCVNDDFRAYFEARDLPAGTCASDAVRCSGCWLRGEGGETAIRPPLLVSLTDARPHGRRGAAEAKVRESRIVRQVERLLRTRRGGLAAYYMEKTLRGEDHFWSAKTGRMEPLWPELVNSASFGVMPGLRREDLGAALDAMRAAGRLVSNPDRPTVLRLADLVRSDEARRERIARAAAARATAKPEQPVLGLEVAT